MGEVTEQRLGIVREATDIVEKELGRSGAFQNHYSGPDFHRDKLQPESGTSKTFWMPDQVRHDGTFYGQTLIICLFPFFYVFSWPRISLRRTTLLRFETFESMGIP